MIIVGEIPFLVFIDGFTQDLFLVCADPSSAHR